MRGDGWEIVMEARMTESINLVMEGGRIGHCRMEGRGGRWVAVMEDGRVGRVDLGMEDGRMGGWESAPIWSWRVGGKYIDIDMVGSDSYVDVGG